MPTYTPKHAFLMTLGLIALCAAWAAWVVGIGLPLHPWCTMAEAVAVLGAAFFFAVLDKTGARWFHRLFAAFEWAILAAVVLALVFSVPGAPFPLWAAALPVAVFIPLAAALLFFGVRSMFREFRYWQLTGHLLGQ